MNMLDVDNRTRNTLVGMDVRPAVSPMLLKKKSLLANIHDTIAFSLSLYLSLPLFAGTHPFAREFVLLENVLWRVNHLAWYNN